MARDFEKMKVSDISRVTGINAKTIHRRMSAGMSKTEAATKPLYSGPRDYYKQSTRSESDVVPVELQISKEWLRKSIFNHAPEA